MLNVEELAKQKRAGGKVKVQIPTSGGWRKNQDQEFTGDETGTKPRLFCKVLIRWEGLSWAVPSACQAM